jgi:hypothetical protein
MMFALGVVGGLMTCVFALVLIFNWAFSNPIPQSPEPKCVACGHTNHFSIYFDMHDPPKRIARCCNCSRIVWVSGTDQKAETNE